MMGLPQFLLPICNISPSLFITVNTMAKAVAKKAMKTAVAVTRGGRKVKAAAPSPVVTEAQAKAKTAQLVKSKRAAELLKSNKAAQLVKSKRATELLKSNKAAELLKSSKKLLIAEKQMAKQQLQVEQLNPTRRSHLC